MSSIVAVREALKAYFTDLIPTLNPGSVEAGPMEPPPEGMLPLPHVDVMLQDVSMSKMEADIINVDGAGLATYLLGYDTAVFDVTYLLESQADADLVHTEMLLRMAVDGMATTGRGEAIEIKMTVNATDDYIVKLYATGRRRFATATVVNERSFWELKHTVQVVYPVICKAVAGMDQTGLLYIVIDVNGFIFKLNPPSPLAP